MRWAFQQKKTNELDPRIGHSYTNSKGNACIMKRQRLCVPVTLDTLSSPKASKIIFILLCVTVLLAIIVRALYFNANPPALNQDEAMHGYNAYSIVKTLKDHWGNLLPIFMGGFGINNYVMPLYTYLTVPFVMIWGLSETTVRIAALLINVAAIPLVYLLANRLFKNKVIALLGAILYSFNPWSIHYSRIAHEATLQVFFYILIILLFYIALTDPKRKLFFTFGGAIAGISVYTYHVAWVLSPVLVLILCLVFWKEALRNWQGLLGAFLVAIVIAFPIYIKLFTFEIGKESRLAGVTALTAKSPFTTMALNYASYYSPKFLFFEGDPNLWTLPGTADQYGMFHTYLLAFIPCGAAYSVYHMIARREMRREILLVLIFAVIAFLPPATTVPERYALRAYTLIPIFHIIAAIGMWVIAKSVSETGVLRGLRAPLFALLSVLMLASVGNFLYKYYFVFPKLEENYGKYQYGIKQACTCIKQHGNEYDKIYFTNDVNQPFIYILFYLSYDPALYQRIDKDQIVGDWGVVYSFDKYYFKDDGEMPLDEKRALFITRPSKRMSGKTLIETIRNPDQKVEFEIWK
jgi:4-amino-4-deoxy-L-arabinose transferase-like glycosyltransferase